MRSRSALLFLLPFAPLASLGCNPPPRLAESAPTTIHIDPAGPKSGPPALARFVPIDVLRGVPFGAEPGGGVRSIAAGVRVVALPGGGVLTAAERLPGTRWEVVALPDRLGGGFLFEIEHRSIWRADRWLGPARAIYTSAPGATISAIVPGLDRVYLRARGWRAIDGATGEARPLGPWPASPAIGGYAAADGWRALAIADLRGLVATSDAGATWRTIALPIDPREVSVVGDALQVRGVEGGRSLTSYELRPDGQVARVSDMARTGSDAESSAAEPMGALGRHPLAAAVDDGWPLGDGTAVVARDGALTRVRLDDGAVVETAPAAFSLRPSRCHPIALGGSFGFVCGEPRGATILYSFDAAASHGGMTEVRRFDVPRAVLASGNGAIAVRGPCDVHAESSRVAGDGDAEVHHYCVRTVEGDWSEIRVEGAVGDERVAVLADGRFAIVSPPKGRLDSARLTIVDKGHPTSAPIVLSDGAPLSPDLARVLDVGVWLDGIEERRPGVLAGWVEASGTMLGYELTLDGKARLGALVRGDKLLPMVSGRYGLGWSSAHDGYETTDGGMTWTAIPVPEPMSLLPAITSRACGPVGCSAAGWLRIGWGLAEKQPPRLLPQPPVSLPRNRLSLALECVPGEPADAPHVKGGHEDLLGGPPAGATPSTEVRSVTFDTGTAGRVFAWGSRSDEWGPETKWMVRWLWPFGGASDVRSSAPVAAPSLLIEAARFASGPFFPLGWRVVLGDDPSHALLIAARRNARAEGTLFVLEADHGPVEVRRADGEPLGDPEAEVRVAGRWYVVTPASGRREVIVWQLDGPIAHELARIPRTPRGELSDPQVAAGRLAVRSDGRALGYVVDGQPSPERSEPTRWVAPIDLDTGLTGDLEPLGSVDFGDRTSIPTCAGDEVGWLMDLPVDGPTAFPISLSTPHGSPSSLGGAFARMRIGRSRACVERLAGTSELSNDGVARGPSQAAVLPGSIPVTVGDRHGRSVFRCGVR